MLIVFIDYEPFCNPSNYNCTMNTRRKFSIVIKKDAADESIDILLGARFYGAVRSAIIFKSKSVLARGMTRLNYEIR